MWQLADANKVVAQKMKLRMMIVRFNRIKNI
jgi:hypothetical protein